MTNDQLKELQDKLWDSANSMRAYGGIKASDYAVPVLGLIFLRFADNKYSQFEDQILEEYQRDKGTRMERAISAIAVEKCGFYLPENARYDYLNNLPEDKSLAKALREAMEGIEKFQDEQFQGVLPTDTYFEIEKKKDDILPELMRTFADIPKDATGDVFGLIYEYFLGKFAMAEGQKGGQFFTPTSVVRFIVEVIEPYSGKIYDPACGSAGMFVQSAKFVREANRDTADIYVCGQEFMGETVRLAKMNLLVNNIRGEITEGNSYEIDPYKSFGKFDYVMANPPFNVKSVKESTVKNDPRFYNYGLPKNKGKKDDKISDANYLWVSLFATSLNEGGRAGFVMPNSASDARNAEKDIRKKVVDSGIVDVMVSMPSNMFFTVTLPATLWFLDKGKVDTDRKDKILFLDARNTYRQIDRAHREWTADHQQNLATIVRLYRGEQGRFTKVIDNYFNRIADLLAHPEPQPSRSEFEELLEAVEENGSAWWHEFLGWAHPQFSGWAKQKKNEKHLSEFQWTPKSDEVFNTFHRAGLANNELWSQVVWFNSLKAERADLTKHADIIQKQTTQKEALERVVGQAEKTIKELRSALTQINAFFDLLEKKIKIKKDNAYRDLKAATLPRLEQPLKAAETTLALFGESLENIEWLQKRFPNGEYRDVVGLCKVADLTEVAEEQDYSLNAGRYVGIEIEGEDISSEDYKKMMTDFKEKIEGLNQKDFDLSKQIENDLIQLINDLD